MEVLIQRKVVFVARPCLLCGRSLEDSPQDICVVCFAAGRKRRDFEEKEQGETK